LRRSTPKLPSDFDYSATKNGAIDGALCGRRKDHRWKLPMHRCAGLAQARLSSIAAAVLLGLEAGWRKGGVDQCRDGTTSRDPEIPKSPYGEGWTDVEQRFRVVWTQCRFGGDRPWFVCSVYANGTYCGRQIAKLYQADRLFACRHCSRLAYASQQESTHERGLLKAQRIRMRLGGTANMLDDFPEKPKGMHWRTYERLCRVHDAAKARSIIGLMGFVKRLRRRAS
jgi:hypothetical protein